MTSGNSSLTMLDVSSVDALSTTWMSSSVGVCADNRDQGFAQQVPSVVRHHNSRHLHSGEGI